jgi:outer membrane protein OmpA-like peptidoglycan-associated protein
MKKLILLLIVGYSISTEAQTKQVKSYTTDKELGAWVIDMNFKAGGFKQTMDIANTTPNYLNGININTGNAAFEKGKAIGGDIQIGYFFGKGRHWGLGTGLLYLRESGDVTLKNYHAEYQATDNNGYIFRQVVTANDITEHIKSDNFNIPLVLKYKNRFSKHWGIAIEGGALFNIKASNSYATNASFDYEAIYKFTANDVTNTPIYETSLIPDAKDFLITKSQFIKNNPQGSVAAYFDTKRNAGYKVGLDITPDSKTGKTNYDKGSIGFIIQPSFNYFFSDHVALNVGGYFLTQTFKNSNTGTYTTTNKMGDYNSVVNSASTIHTQSYGGNIGLRFFLGKKSKPMVITNTDINSPSTCGLCDGSFVLHGLEAGKQVNVQYIVNDVASPVNYSAVVSPQGTVVVSGLCAGNYDDIEAKIGNKTAKSADVTLTDPMLNISSEVTLVSAANSCDGAITLRGLKAGQKATVSYTFNGKMQPTYSTTVSHDNSVVLSRLCEGRYADIVVTSNKCKGTADPSNFVLNAPAKIATPAAVPVVTNPDDLQSVLFDFDTYNIKPESYKLLDAAYAALENDKDMYIVIDGNTDAVGTETYNQELSEKRSQAVKDYLVNKGINGDRIEMHASGENQPVASNSTDNGRRLNRRTAMVLKIKR